MKNKEDIVDQIINELQRRPRPIVPTAVNQPYGAYHGSDYRSARYRNAPVSGEPVSLFVFMV